MSSNAKCLKCIHYYSTYDASRPRGCKAYRFSSAVFPSIVIKRESGEECKSFQERPSKKKKDLDLNDPSLW